MNIQWGQDKWPLAQITKVPWDCSSASQNPACLTSKRQEAEEQDIAHTWADVNKVKRQQLPHGLHLLRY